MSKKYTIEEIREAVDISTGDDGFRSKEVISILQTFGEGCSISAISVASRSSRSGVSDQDT